MLHESPFNALADATLEALMESLEAADTDENLDIDLIQGILTITLENGKQFIVSKHGPSRQLWLSSPISGGLHFPYDEEKKDWILADGRILAVVLRTEIAGFTA